MKSGFPNSKIAAAAIGCLIAGGVQAVPTDLNVGLSSADVLGEVILNNVYSAPSGGQEVRDQAMVNTLIGIYNGSVTQVNPYHLSANNFGAPPLPFAITTGDVITPFSGMSFASDGDTLITLGASAKYLIAAWDGGHSGAVVWDIGALAGTTVEIPSNVLPNAAGTDMITGDKYQITTWSVFDANPSRNVPDGASTMMLLGTGMLGLYFMRRVTAPKKA